MRPSSFVPILLACLVWESIAFSRECHTSLHGSALRAKYIPFIVGQTTSYWVRETTDSNGTPAISVHGMEIQVSGQTQYDGRKAYRTLTRLLGKDDLPVTQWQEAFEHVSEEGTLFRYFPGQGWKPIMMTPEHGKIFKFPGKSESYEWEYIGDFRIPEYPLGRLTAEYCYQLVQRDGSGKTLSYAVFAPNDGLVYFESRIDKTRRQVYFLSKWQ